MVAMIIMTVTHRMKCYRIINFKSSYYTEGKKMAINWPVSCPGSFSFGERVPGTH